MRSVARFVAFLVTVVVAQRLAPVLLQLSLERSEADSQGLRGTAPVSSRHLKRREDRLALDFGHRLAHERRDGDGLFTSRHGRRRAAESLGIGLRTLQRKLKEYQGGAVGEDDEDDGDDAGD